MMLEIAAGLGAFVGGLLTRPWVDRQVAKWKAKLP